MLIPRMSRYSLRVCGCYLFDWCEKSHRWCNEKAIKWLVVNWPRVSERRYWSSLVSSDIAFGHVSPALSKRKLMSHQNLFCFSRITRFATGLLLRSVVHLISLVVGCWEPSFSCSNFLAGRTCLSKASQPLGSVVFGTAPHLSDACVLNLSTTCEAPHSYNGCLSAGGLFLLPEGTAYSRFECG